MNGLKLFLVFAIGHFFISVNAQVGVGTTSPDASSVLDVTATDKGVLIPRVSLSDVTTTMLDGTNVAATGLLIYNTNASVVGGNGVGYYYFNGTIWEQISTSATSNDHDFYEEGTTTSPNSINDDIYTQGNVAIGKNIANYALDIEENSETRALNVAITSNSNANNYSAYFENLSTGTGEHFGIRTNVSGSDKIYGSYNDLTSNGNGYEMYGTYNNMAGTFTSSGPKYGVYNNFENLPAQLTVGVQNEMMFRESNNKKGVVNNLESNGIAHGVENEVYGGTFAIGTDNRVSGGLNASAVIGTRNIVDGNSIFTNYASYNKINTPFNGPRIGVYSEVLPSTGYAYAGYFRGKLAIGTTVFNSGSADFYVLPESRGLVNQIMQSDGAGNVSWVDRFSQDYNDLSNTPVHNINNLVDGKSDSDGTNNGSSIFLGVNAGLNDDSTNNHNVGIGFESLMSNFDGNYNSAIGHSSMKNNTSGINNSAYGFWSLFNNMSGNNNTAVGVAAGYSNFYGSRNVFLGTSSGSTSSYGDGNIYIGYSAGQLSAGDNKLYIENSNADADNALIYGEFDNNILRVNGELQLGDSLLNRYAMPTADGNLNQLLQTDGSGQLNWVDGTTIGTDNQTISYNATTGQLDIEDGNSVNLSIGDITEVTAGDGLTGGGTNGALILDVVATNGLTTNANNIELGGTLTQGTTITQGTNNMVFNLSSSGDFLVQDNGINHFEVRSTGLTYFGDDTIWNDGSTTGTTVASLIDDGDDGRFRIYENGSASVDIDANTGFIFNEQGLDRDFRIESDDETSMFRVDAANNRIGVMEAIPSYDIHLKQSTRTEAGTGGIAFESSDTSNTWKIYHSGANFSFSENGIRRGYVEGGTGNYIPTSDRRLKKNITEVKSILDKVDQLKTYRYIYKDQDLSSKKIIGFMAQDVQPLFPELVGQAEDGYFGLNYAGFGVIAIKAIQEQQDIIDAQQQEIDALQKSQNDTESLIRSLLKRIEALENQD